MALFSFRHSVKTFSPRCRSESRKAKRGQTAAHLKYITRKSAAREVISVRIGMPSSTTRAAAAEVEAEKRKGRVCERFIIALPVEATPEQRTIMANAFAEELIHGTLEHLEAVDSEMKEYAANWTFDRIAKVDLSVLRLAIFELLQRRDIPPIVSINEAIELGKIYSTPDSKRFINGILDKMKNKIDRPHRSAAD